MMTSNNYRDSAWGQLADPAPHQLVIQLVDPESRWWFSWAKTAEFPAAIYLEVNMKLSFVDKSIQGIVIEAGPTNSDKSSLMIAMRNREDLEIFEVFCRRLISVANEFESEESMVRAVRDEIQEWHEFLGRARRGLSVAERMGLFAELVTLRTLAEKIGPAQSLKTWVGPIKSAKDFLKDAAALEIKAVLNEGKIVHISSEYQLSLSETDVLFLIVVRLTEIESGENIRSVCEELEATHFGLNTAESSEFRRKLGMLGVQDYATYDVDSWAVSKIEVLEVDSDFPRLVRESLPEDIVATKYSLSLTGLDQFQIDPSHAISRFVGLPDA